MENFFDRVDTFWPAGRRDLHWHILPSPAEAAELTAPYAHLVDRPGLAPVPDRWLHCTLLHAIGVTVDEVDIDQLVESVTLPAEAIAPFTLTFDRPSVGAVGVEISGRPGQPFDLVAGLTVTATAQAAPGFRPGLSRYPHMSLAYTTTGSAGLKATDLRAGLAAIDQPLTGTVLVDRLHLAKQWHDGQHIMWCTLAEVPLRGATSPLSH